MLTDARIPTHRLSGARRALRRRALAALAVGALGATAVTAAVHTTPAEAAAPSITVSATPGLYPSFSTTITDYVIRCTGAPVALDVTAPAGAVVVVDWQRSQSGSFSTTVGVTSGQGFTITASNTNGSGSATYYVRCLPTDFPTFTSSVPGTPQAAFYMVLPATLALFSPTPPAQYVTLFDRNGVPVWWLRQGASTDAKVFPNGHIGTILHRSAPHIQELTLDGTLVHGVNAADGFTDNHDVQLLPNGNYLAAAVTQSTGDLRFMGGPRDAAIVNQVIQELTPTGQVVWSWDAAAHIALTETDRLWWDTILNPTGPSFGFGFDNYHWNSAQQLGNYILLSFRHENAVYLVDKTTGSIVWKLGGTKTAQSLKIVGDPVFSVAGNGFGGQHYARFSGSTGAITLQDNGTNRNRAPRGVRYVISLSKRTATLVESISDPLAPDSACCGSAAKLTTGNWVASWGFNPIVTELSPLGVRQFLITFAPGTFSYRVDPVMPGVLTIAQLRAAMNTQHPRT